MGIDIAAQKLLSFVIGSFFAGIGGGIYAHYNRLPQPQDVRLSRRVQPLIIIVSAGWGA